MRITNKIMQRNNLSNINTNKVYQDTLSNQMSTQKKINKPSDDPVVAIRALRLRSNVTEITQYYSKNIPDAESWLSVTEDALNNLSSILTSMIGQCTKGSNGDLKTSDREIILNELKALSDEVYTTGDVDYAGRYVFTGYRTNTSMSFEKEQTVDYSITEQLNRDAIDSVIKVNTKTAGGTDLIDWTSANCENAGMAALTEEDINTVTVHRFRLAYDDVNADATPSIQFRTKDANGDYSWTTWGTHPETGAIYSPAIDTVHSYDDPYTKAAEDPNALIYVPETGELLLGENRYNELMEVKDDDTTASNEAEIRITYQKSSWKQGDLRPEHYFYCKTDADTDKEIEYNPSYLTDNVERQDIEYDVGFNQTIRVNSTADECFRHGIGREVDDLVNAMQDVLNLEKIQTNIQNALKSAESGSATADTLQQQLDAINKALTYAKDKEQKLFEQGITAFQGYLDDASLCITECGSRSSKLSLIQNRMQSQKTTFETLKSENEDVDITEVAIQLSSAELTYEAALAATGKVMKTSLLNYI